MSEKYEAEQQKVLSIPYGINVNKACQIVKKMIQSGYKLSSAHYDSLYFYTLDKVCVASISKHHDDSKKTDSYSGEIVYTNSSPVFNISKDFYDKIISNLSRKKDGKSKKSQKAKKITFADFKQFYESKQSVDDDAFIQSVLYLIENNCQMNFVNRLFYFFDKNPNHPDKQHAGIWELNHENKLVKYNMPTQQQWFLTSDFGSRPFSESTKRSEQLFNLVEHEYQKQR